MIKAMNKAATLYQLGDELMIDLLGGRMTEGKRVVKLTTTEITIMGLLLASEWVRPVEITTRLFGQTFRSDYNNIRVRISRLRRKMDNFETCVLIEMDRKKGYRLVEDGENG